MNSEKVLLCGEIATGLVFDNYATIKLIQNSGYKIDLICRFAEIADTYGKSLTVKYWMTDTPTTFKDAQEGFVKQLLGAVIAELEANEYSYSEYTSGVDYDSELKIGGHDLFAELNNSAGKYIWLQVEWSDT